MSQQSGSIIGQMTARRDHLYKKLSAGGSNQEMLAVYREYYDVEQVLKIATSTAKNIKTDDNKRKSPHDDRGSLKRGPTTGEPFAPASPLKRQKQ